MLFDLSRHNLNCQINELQDKAPITAQEAKESGLIDTVRDRRDPLLSTLFSVEAILAASKSLRGTQQSENTLAAAMKSGRKQVKDIHAYYQIMEKYSEFKESRLAKAPEVPKMNIGMVYLSGSMRRGVDQFGATTVSQALLAAAKKKEIDAIVFRIDSGGGEAISAETIWQAVKEVQERYKKPVIASFGNVCASGGYYVAAPCDMIIAQPTTITGSIGVASSRPIVLPKLMQTLGFTVDEIGFTESFRNTTFLKKLSGPARERYEKQVDAIYDHFLKRVSEGRRIDIDHLRKHVAGGRVFSGVDAKELKLVDELGKRNSSLSPPAYS
jgi:signal peptide peptidase SppA